MAFSHAMEMYLQGKLLLPLPPHSLLACILWQALLQNVSQKLEHKVWNICHDALQRFELANS